MNTKTVLIVSPDYVSHVYPMAAIGDACRKRGMRVVIASGPGVEPWVRAQGFEYASLSLGPGNNRGLLRLEEQRLQQAEHMAQFYAATCQGPIETLLYQSRARRHDMLHAPEAVFGRLRDIVEHVRPTLVLGDQISYNTTLALHGLGLPYVSFVPSNPTNIPGEDELFGMPTRFPRSIRVPRDEITTLREVCRQMHQSFTAHFNAALARIAPQATPVHDAFRHTSPWQVLMNYPRALAIYRYNRLPPNTVFLGSSLRREPEDSDLAAFLAQPSRRPTVYLSFGSYLSTREDVLERIVGALRSLNTRAVIAAGVATISKWGPLPTHWYVRSVLPQIQALRSADLAIFHGGNNTLTEALTFGVPLLIGPFSSDQFDNAADVEEAGAGESFDPNAASSEMLKDQIERVLRSATMRRHSEALGRELRSSWGPDKAADALLALGQRTEQDGSAIDTTILAYPNPAREILRPVVAHN